ncbi:MAG: RdgB/HAM1 family non-canonical purine NTP pyrophosphatase [Bacteroidales bacterium]|nr:RdgB/HAM1 family non-canonical purine NTP pyrophosphatase [Bacteroidales bacterium]
MKMLKIVFASNNRHKLEEISKLISELPITILTLRDIGWTDEIPEDFETFEQNAYQKASTIYNHTGLPCFADDSGLEVEALNGLPGVRSARFSVSRYPDIPDNERDKFNNMLLLEMMQKETNRRAQFRTVICFIKDGKPLYFEGTVKGVIADEPIGKEGFGYDPLFIPDGYNVTFAQMPMEQKNLFSHRAKAVEKFIYYLKSHLVAK